MESLEEVRDEWEKAAQRDAMGYILNAGTPWTPEAFFANGTEEIDRVLGRLKDLGLLGGYRRALDFGCGVGRCTQALTGWYQEVVGVDIAPTMIEWAKKLNQYDGQVRYEVKERLNYRKGTFDLVYTNLVLQHMPQRFAHEYIREFIRILSKDGLAVFEYPEGTDYRHGDACLSMWASPHEVVEETVKDAGGEVVDVELIVEPSSWNCYRYSARRRK